MGENSGISWTDHTFNAWWGCVKVSEACKNCYAETWAKRMGFDLWGPASERRFFGDKHWTEPLKWDRRAAAEGVTKRVFCQSMSDLFERHPDSDTNALMDAARARVFALAEQTKNLLWLFLTKRTENVLEMVPEHWRKDWFPRNVMIGATVENQLSVRRVADLLELPASRRFLSCEPLFEALDLEYPEDLNPQVFCCDAIDCGCRGLPVNPPLMFGIEWVIAGGESGVMARPSHPRWFDSLMRQAKEWNALFHFKQWGEWGPHPLGKAAHPPIEGVSISSNTAFFSDGTMMLRSGKKAAGRQLDGREWNEVPL